MSLLKKVRQRSVERKFGGTHPILRMGLDRNTVDAYFTGLVFAAVADDEAIDKSEREKLARIGSALNVPEEDARSMMTDMLARDSDAKIAIAEECANVLKGSPSVRLFVCEWSQVWMSHNYKQEELDEFRAQLCEWLGVECEKNFCAAFDTISTGVEIDEAMLHRLTDMISEDDLLYLCSDKADEIKRILDAERAQKEREEKARKEREAAEQRAKEAKHREEKEYKALRGSYDALTSFGNKCVRLYGQRLTPAILKQVSIHTHEVKIGDKQKLFNEIGRQFVERIESLHLPCPGMTLFKAPTKKRDEEGFDAARLISQQTVWMLIALVPQRALSGNIPCKGMRDLLCRASRFDGSCESAISLLWLGADGCESVFCPLLKVRPIGLSLLEISDHQRKKIQAWKNKQAQYTLDELRRYADSIGISPYRRGAVFRA